MKSSRTSSSMHRTGTMPISLPKITKLNIKQSRYNNTNNNINRSSLHNINTSRSNNKHSQSFMQSTKSPFTTRVSHQVIDKQQYPYIQTTNIQKQQLRLKQLLKQFNQQTVNILQKYIIDRPIKKQYIKKKPLVQQLHHVRERQGENSINMIILMKKQIQSLQSRCQDLKYMSKQQFEYKIRQLKQQKSKMIVYNKQISREITLNGLQMVKGKQSQVKELEYQQFLIDNKRDRLKNNTQSVMKQLKQLQQKINILNTQRDTYQQTQGYTLKQQTQTQRQKTQQRLYQQYMSKQRYHQHLKVITQSNNYQLKHKYFKSLKMLQQRNNSYDQIEDNHTKLLVQIDSALNVIKEMETRHQVLVGGNMSVSNSKSKYASYNKLIPSGQNKMNHQQNTNNNATNIIFNTQPQTNYLQSQS